MLLKYLNDHLLSEVAAYLSDRDLNALVQTCRRTSGRLNITLYHRNIPAGRPYLLQWGVQKGVVGTVRQAIVVGASVAYKEARYNPVLVQAAILGNLDMVATILTAYDADVNVTGMYNRTALTNACILADMNLVKLLFRAAAEAGVELAVDVADAAGMTPIMYAARLCNVDLFRMLLATGRVNASARCRSGLTPLHHAIDCGGITEDVREKCVELLLLAGADPAARDRHSRTVLRLATDRNLGEIVRQLLATGEVDPDAEEAYGRLETARGLARRRSRRNLTRMFELYTARRVRVSVRLTYH
ncbi:hypothetical protein PLICBS_002110 [Purpureocillium lilacinum]|uniref:uncharacterized protein n=1 Tax=Purpureocillium lilacinum TaxID=33203 RepID=UPI002089D748|nr:hypothetical protein PLICBS_002110 [Purpureocillium lilacinum]